MISGTSNRRYSDRKRQFVMDCRFSLAGYCTRVFIASPFAIEKTLKPKQGLKPSIADALCQTRLLPEIADPHQRCIVIVPAIIAIVIPRHIMRDLRGWIARSSRCLFDRRNQADTTPDTTRVFDRHLRPAFLPIEASEQQICLLDHVAIAREKQLLLYPWETTVTISAASMQRCHRACSSDGHLLACPS